MWYLDLTFKYYIYGLHVFFKKKQKQEKTYIQPRCIIWLEPQKSAFSVAVQSLKALAHGQMGCNLEIVWLLLFSMSVVHQ